jgi:hypothetical protein
MAQIGILILVGIVVNNGIVLIHHVHQLRERGMPRTDALLKAGRDRLRPILMTTATTVLGLMPLAFGNTHVGDILYFPLARTVIGGLLTSTLLTLLLVPCLYTLLEDGARVISGAWSRRKPAGLIALLALVLLAPAARAGDGETLRGVDGRWSAAGAKQVDIRFPVGELAVVATDGDEIVAHMDVQGGDDPNEQAFKNARKVRFALTRHGDRLQLSVQGFRLTIGDSHTMLDGRIEVPRSLALGVDMNVGELAVSGFERATRLGLGVGELTIECDPARVGRIDVDLGIGEGNLVEDGRSREWAGVFGGGFHRDGVPGGAPVKLKLGVGEATVTMTSGAYSSVLPK